MHSPLEAAAPSVFVPFPPMQVVVVNQVLACNATLGYEDTFNTQVGRAAG
jgi:hypothetical protein